MGWEIDSPCKCRGAHQNLDLTVDKQLLHQLPIRTGFIREEKRREEVRGEGEIIVIPPGGKRRQVANGVGV